MNFKRGKFGSLKDYLPIQKNLHCICLNFPTKSKPCGRMPRSTCKTYFFKKIFSRNFKKTGSQILDSFRHHLDISFARLMTFKVKFCKIPLRSIAQCQNVGFITQKVPSLNPIKVRNLLSADTV